MDGSQPRSAEPQPGKAPASFDAAAVPDDDMLDVVSLLRTLWRRRWIIFGSSFLLVGLAVLIVVQLTPRYQASVSLMLDPRQQQVVDIESVVSGVNPDAALIESEVLVLRSRDLAESVVRDLRLDLDPEFNPALEYAEKSWWEELAIRDRLSPSAWLPEEWAAAVLPKKAQRAFDDSTQERLELAKVVGAFLKRLTAQPAGRSYVINITFESEDPLKAAEVANKIAEAYLDGQLEAKFEATARASAWLNERLESLRRQVEASERAVVAYRRENNIAEVISGDGTSQQVTELSTQLTMARAERAAAEARLAQVRSLVRGGGAESAAEVLASDLIQNLRGQEAELQRRLSELQTRYGEKHPRIINARAEIRELRASIANEVAKIVQNLQNELQVARARERALEADLQGLKGEANEMRAVEIELAELERDAEADKALYQTFLSRFKETSEQQELQQPDARVISRADVPQSPSFPKKKLIVGLAFAGSLGLGVMLVFLVELLDNGFRSNEQIRQMTGLSTLAMIPLQRGVVGRKSRPDLLISARPTSQYAESIRTLLTSIFMSGVDRPPKTLLITSALPREGKSVTALSLARSAAASGKKVILLECDFRRPTLQRWGLVEPRLRGSRERALGLADVLGGHAPLDDVVQREESPELHIVTAGSAVPNPQDFFDSESMRALLDGLAKSFDLIVLDAPPVLAVSDALVLSRLADKTVMIVQWEKTPRKVVQTALSRLAEARARLAGVALEQVHVRKHAKYGYGDMGYYYGRYRGYYED